MTSYAGTAAERPLSRTASTVPSATPSRSAARIFSETTILPAATVAASRVGSSTVSPTGA